MAPREALQELTWVLLACLFFDKLTQTSALRLYRIPSTSQLFPHLGGDWATALQDSSHPVHGRTTNLPSMRKRQK